MQEIDNSVCPESTLESATRRTSRQTGIAEAKVPNLARTKVCESTVDSAPRRDFIKKAAIATAAVGIGGTLLGKALPQSSAKSDCAGGCFSCCNVCGTGVAGYAPKQGGLGVYGFGACRGVAGCSKTGVGVEAYARCGVGIPLIAWGNSSCGPGPYGDLQQWKSGTGKCNILDAINGHGWLGVLTPTPSSELDVVGSATVSSEVSVGGAVSVGSSLSAAGSVYVGGSVGIGTCSPDAKLSFGTYVGDSVFLYDAPGDKFGLAIRDSELRIFHGAVASGCHTSFGSYNGTCFTESMRLTNQGNLGIGTTSPCAPLSVVGSSPLVGQFISKAASADKSALVEFQNNDTTAVDWKIGVAGKCNSAGISDGSFYFQHPGVSAIGLTINKCGYVGINNVNPERRLCITGRIQASCGVGVGTQTINTTLAVNGSIAAKTRSVSASTTMLASDYAVFTSGSIKLTLPAASTQNGMMLVIKKTDSSSTTLTIDAASGDNIETAGSKTLIAQFSSYTLISNGIHEWFIIATGT